MSNSPLSYQVTTEPEQSIVQSFRQHPDNKASSSRDPTPLSRDPEPLSRDPETPEPAEDNVKLEDRIGAQMDLFKSVFADSENEVCWLQPDIWTISHLKGQGVLTHNTLYGLCAH